MSKLPKPAIGLKQRIVSSVRPQEFYAEFFSDFRFSQNQSCVFPRHEDNTPSLKIQEDGAYLCYGCDTKGSNIVQFWADAKGVSYEDALKQVYKKFLASTIDVDKIKLFRSKLKDSVETIEFLKTTRGWTDAVIQSLNLGLYDFSGTRYLVIPIKNEYGFYSCLKYYNHLHSGDVKFFFDKDGDNSSKIYGLHSFTKAKKIYLFEGEPDCILGLSLGLASATFGGAAVWKDSWRHYFQGYDVVIIYDGDGAGRAGAKKISLNLHSPARSIKVISLPEGQDFTDYIKEHGEKAFKSLEADSDYYKHATFSDVPRPSSNGEVKDTTLEDAATADHHNQVLRMPALVAGKEPSPYFIPRRIRFSCADAPNPSKCASCSLGEMPDLPQAFEIDTRHPGLLELLCTRARDMDRAVRKVLGVNPRCKVECVVEDHHNIEKAIINPPIDNSTPLVSPSKRVIYYIGVGLQLNRNYDLTFYNMPHPMDNSAVHVVTEAVPMNMDLEDFKCDKEDILALTSFCPTSENPMNKLLEDITRIQESNISRIWGRPILHQAVDLMFFSPNEFYFADEHVRKAGLDILVFGDQRCGKGRVAEGLAQYYKFGEVLSGENISFMNLVGGIETSDNYRGLRWGRLVANDRGVVVIDEASALPLEVFAKLSRIRSEGLAELDKFGIHSKAPARCSLLWIANPRKRTLAEYTYAVEALPALVGQPEDIARFDYAIPVRNEEVDTSLINQYHEQTRDIYGWALHRKLILWCKTRRADQILFHDPAIAQVYESAKILGAKYSSKIPLVQAANIRIKIAKVAAAIAGRVFSNTDDGNSLFIRTKHVDAAVEFLEKTYELLGYREYSQIQGSIGTVNVEALEKHETIAEMRNTGAGVYQSFCAGLLRENTLTHADIQDYSTLPAHQARDLSAHLVREGALKRVKNYYAKTPSFIKYLKTQFGGK